MFYLVSILCQFARLTVLVAIVLPLFLSSPASAFQINSDWTHPEVVVPVIAHNPGSHGTEWQTDLWITNPSGDEASVTLTFYPQGKDAVVREVSVGIYGARFFGDIVLETFGLDDDKGLLLVSAPETSLEVRGRIFNTGGGEGEFGQAFFGIPTRRLSRQGFLSGVSTAEGNRVSVGIANPTERSFDVTMIVRDADGNNVYREVVSLSPHELVQFNNVAQLWGLPAADVLTIYVQHPLDLEDSIYSYASVVRNDNGDATFIFGTAPNSGPLRFEK